MCSPTKKTLQPRAINVSNLEKELVLITDDETTPKKTSTKNTNAAPRSASFRKKQVRFGMVKIYHCGVALGASPCVSTGPPICLGPLVRTSSTTANAIEMEAAARDWFSGTQSNVGKRHKMLLSSDDRVRMLLTAGFSQKEIELATVTAWEDRISALEAIQRRRAKKERSDSFRRLFSKFSFMEGNKEETVDRKELVRMTKNPTIRAASAC